MSQYQKAEISQKTLEYYMAEGRKARARAFICWFKFWQGKPTRCIEG